MWQQEGFLKGEVNVNDAMKRLEFYIQSIPEQIKNISKEELLIKPASGKWSKQEILGHLIDSALNNLKRFTEIQFLPQPYIVNAYNQNELVNVNGYQNMPLDHLLNLWKVLNRQIIFVVQEISDEKLNYAVDPQYEKHELKTLGWIIGDYVVHMEHHFKQIFPD